MITSARDSPSAYLSVAAECIGCGWCAYTCPVPGCIRFDPGLAAIDPAACIECGRCIFVCPVDVIVPLRAPRPRPLHERA